MPRGASEFSPRYRLTFNSVEPYQIEDSSLKKPTRRSGPSKKKQAAAEVDSRSHALEEANKTASFVAHELNNLLTVIQINAEFLLASASEDPETAEELDEIQRASRRASILARQLLASAKLEPFDRAAAEASLKKKMSRASVEKARAAVGVQAPRIGETILLVEDEADLRALTKKILSHNGYRVLDAADGAIALRLAAGHVGEIDLVLTDVAMPNLGGRGMVEELRELSQDMRVLFMSGYPKEEVFPDKEVAKATAYIQKPFTRETLLSEVRGALGYAT
jgi:CheY-like chemotaxis protein